MDRAFWSVVGTWRNIVGDSSYDSLLKVAGSPYVRYQLTGKIKNIEDELELLLEDIRYNKPLRTELVLFTDRVRTFGARHLKAMITGDGNTEGSSPYYYVSWENTDNDFTALVKETGNKNVGIDVYSHSLEDYNVTLRLWQLQKGRYNFQITDNGSVIDTKEFDFTQPGTRVKFNLPAGKLISINVNKK